MLVSLIALDIFHPLLSTQLTVDLTPEWSGGSTFNLLSHIYAKTPFGCIETVASNAESLTHCCFLLTVSKHSTHFENSFLIEEHSCKMVNTLPSDIFNSSAISCNFNLPLATTSVEFLGIFGDNCRIWVTWAFSIICVCTTTFKVK